MKFYRIKALFKRYMIALFSDFVRMVDFFYWPFIDIALWGFTSKWIQDATSSNISVMLLSGLVLWQAPFRANMEVSYNLMEELWARNVINLFSTPMTLAEWIVAAMGCGIFKAIAGVAYAALLVWFFYDINFFAIGYIGIPFFILLLLSDWSMGFLAGTIIIYWGQRFQSIVWMGVWLFSLISAVFYPLNVLPTWIQLIAKIFPMAHVFEGMRDYFSTGIWPLQQMIISLILNIIYLILILIIFKFSFERSRLKGLARLEVE